MRLIKKYFKIILFLVSLLLLIFITYEFNTLYDKVPLWDTIMHALTGFFMVMLVIVIYKYKKIVLPKFVIILLSFFFFNSWKSV